MTPPSVPIHAMGTDELRLARMSLRHEITQIKHWRRLVRARLDLTVARAVPPDRLGLPGTAYTAIAPAVAHGVLMDIALVPDAGLSVTDLPALRSAETSLADYEAAVRRTLTATDDALIDRLNADLVAAALPDLLHLASDLGRSPVEREAAGHPVP